MPPLFMYTAGTYLYIAMTSLFIPITPLFIYGNIPSTSPLFIFGAGIYIGINHCI